MLKAVAIAMSDHGEPVHLSITFGRNMFAITGHANMTWGDVLAELASAADCDPSSIRLLFKGKTADPKQKLTGVKTGTKLMALKTKGQHVAEKKQEARAKQAEGRAAAERLLSDAAPAAQSDLESGSAKTPSRKIILGDTVDSDTEFYVRIVHGSQWYNLVLPAASCIGDIQKRLNSLCGISKSNQRLVFRGRRDFGDDALLSDIGAVKRGSTFLLLANMRHHDIAEAKLDISRLKTGVAALEEKTKGLHKRVRGRLLNDFVDLTIAIGELEGEALRLEDNIASVRLLSNGDGSGPSEELVERIRIIKMEIESLRDHASSTFG